jgi:hypothetical protein
MECDMYDAAKKGYACYDVHLEVASGKIISALCVIQERLIE